jgi:hypothetical protein
VVVPAPNPWRTEGEGLDEVARRALLANPRCGRGGGFQESAEAGAAGPGAAPGWGKLGLVQCGVLRLSCGAVPLVAGAAVFTWTEEQQHLQ